MECKQCGNSLPENAKFCPECGAPVPADDVVEETPSAKEKVEVVEAVIEEDQTTEAEEPVQDVVEEVEETKEETITQEEPVESEEENAQEEEWYYVRESQSAGPFTLEQMIERIRDAQIKEETLVWKAGMADWQKLKDTELKEYLPTPDVKPEGDQWYFVDANNKQNGPYTVEQMKGLIQAHQIYGNTFVWKTGMADWKRLKDTELASYVMPEAPKQESAHQTFTKKPIYISERSIGLSIVLSIVTCSIYYYYWLYTLARDVNECCRAQNKSGPGEPGIVVLLSLITCGLYGIYFYWKAGKVLSELEFDNGYRVSDNSIIMLVLPFLGLGIISMAICQSTLNDICRYGNE